MEKERITSDRFPASRRLRLALNILRVAIVWLMASLLLTLLINDTESFIIIDLFFIGFLVAIISFQFSNSIFEMNDAMVKIKSGYFLQHVQSIDRGTIHGAAVQKEWRIGKMGTTDVPFMCDVVLYGDSLKEHPIAYINGFTQKDAERLVDLIKRS
ncbi:MAG: hypothetical protein P4L67_03095 [Candidatus Pacebacteria bacterium]|nr:hypothetical protein [Candidatus Paceibacterota bacterium]